MAKVLMKKLTIVIVLLTILFIQTKTQRPQSPCPRLFAYETPRRPESDRWYGIVTLLSNIDLNGVWLRLMLDKPALELGNWFGQVDGRDGNKDFLIKNRTVHLQANVPLTVRFYVKYNPNETPPQFAGFRLNARTMCPEGLEEGTTMALELQTSNEVQPTPNPMLPNKPIESANPTVPNNQIESSPPLFISGSANSGGAGFVSNSGGADFVSSSGGSANSASNSGGAGFVSNSGGTNSGGNRRPTTTSTAPPISSGGTNVGNAGGTFVKPGGGFNLGSSHFTDDDDYFPGDYSLVNGTQKNPYNTALDLNAICGTTIPSRSPKSYNQVTMEGEFPWHAAIYRTKGINLVYWCGATLISRQHVITVAHCVTKWKMHDPQEIDNFVVYLGKYYLNRFTTGMQERLIKEIIPHPKYEPKILCNDIAIIKLVSPVEITNYVRPVCLWQDSTDLNSVVDHEGSVVGWGVDEYDRLTQQLTLSKMSVSSAETCIYALPTFYPLFASNTTYCAGFIPETYICNGDSGGGMVLPKSIPDQKRLVWQLRGLVSFSVDLNNRFRCDQSHYVVFTDAAKYLTWIKELIMK